MWPTDKLTALRLGQWLVVEVPATGPGRRAFVSVTPVTTAADEEARRQGWKRADRNRRFILKHWDYDGERLDGWDYDIGAILVKDAAVGSEAELLTTLEEWQLQPKQFCYPWNTDDPWG